MLELTLERKRFLAILIMMTVGIMISSMDIFLPAMPLMRDYFGTTEYLMQMSLMVNPFTSAIVGLFFGRFCDLFGRRPALFASLAFFLIGGFGCCFAESFDVYFASRIVQAIGCGGLSIIGVVILADMFHGIDYARYMSLYGSLFPLVFAFSPVIGAQMTETFGWRSCFILNVICMLILTICLRIFMPETHKRNKDTNQGSWGDTLQAAQQFLTNRQFIIMALGHALPISLTALFLSNGSFVFIDGFGFSPIMYSISQGIPILLNFASALVYRQIIGKMGFSGALLWGAGGMTLFVLGSMALLSGLIPATPAVILSIYCVSNIAMPFIIATCTTRAVELFPEDRGMAVSIVGLFRNLAMVTAVSVAGLFFNGTIFPVYAAMMIVVLSILGIIYLALQRSVVFSRE